MSQSHIDYLALLGELSRVLAELSGIERTKTEAVRRDNLADLNACIKQEQAAGLALRGLERKRTALLTDLKLENTSLDALPDQYPQELQLDAKQAVEELRRQFALYQGTSEVARSTLECNLHEVEKMLAAAGGEDLGGPGYQSGETTPPSGMRTDIRA